MKRKIEKTFLTLICGVWLSFPVSAAPQDLGRCMVGSLDGNDRNHLMTWMFVGMSVHPDLTEFSKVDKKTKKEIDQRTGEIVTRLFVENCPEQFKAAQKAGPMAIQEAFELVGRAAMQELMTNKEVTAAMVNYMNYVDQQKVFLLLSNDESSR